MGGLHCRHCSGPPTTQRTAAQTCSRGWARRPGRARTPRPRGSGGGRREVGVRAAARPGVGSTMPHGRRQNPPWREGAPGGGGRRPAEAGNRYRLGVPYPFTSCVLWLMRWVIWKDVFGRLTRAVAVRWGDSVLNLEEWVGFGSSGAHGIERWRKIEQSDIRGSRISLP